MASIINEVKRESITVVWVIMTFLGGTINSVVLSQLLFFSPNLDLNLKVFVSISIFFIPILFSIISSLSLPEKRIVAPLHIELISIALIILIGVITLKEFLNYYLSTLIISSFLLLVAGLIQDSIVTKIIGIYSSEKDCLFESYSVPMSLDDVSKKLKDKAFSKATGISKYSYTKESEITVYHTPIYEGYQLFLFLKKIPDQKTLSCLMNIVSYERTKYGIIRNTSSDYQTQMIACFLSELLKIEKTPKNNEFYRQSINYALQPTRNKLESERITIRLTLTFLIAIFLALPIVMFWLGFLPEVKEIVAIEIPTIVAILLVFVRREKK